MFQFITHPNDKKDLREQAKKKLLFNNYELWSKVPACWYKERTSSVRVVRISHGISSDLDEIDGIHTVHIQLVHSTWIGWEGL